MSEAYHWYASDLTEGFILSVHQIHEIKLDITFTMEKRQGPCLIARLYSL
jgi:hypothetical protein